MKGPPGKTLTGVNCAATNYKEGILRYCREDGRIETWFPGDANWVQGLSTVNTYVSFQMATVGKDQDVIMIAGRVDPSNVKVEILGHGGDASNWFQASLKKNYKVWPDHTMATHPPKYIFQFPLSQN